MRVIDVVGDSRARHLFVPLKHRYSGLRDVTALPGASIHRLSMEVSARARAVSPPHAVVVLGGICSVTRKNPNTGNLSLRIPSTHYASTNVMEQLEGMMAAAAGWNPNMKVLVCELFGVNLSVTNHLPGPAPHPQQHLVNSIVMDINTRIPALNTYYQVLTPATGDICHDINIDGEPTSDYTYLQDGCHPDSTAVNELADTISLCLMENEFRGLI